MSAVKPQAAATDSPLSPPTLPQVAGPADLVVVGAGVVGLSIALHMQTRGRKVLLLERSDVAAEASRGNAGALAYSDILPLASPGVLRQAPRWLLDPLGPLSIPPSYLPGIAPWLWRFWRASHPRRVLASTLAQVGLMKLAAQAMPRLLQLAGASHLLHTDGNLHLYESGEEWHASLPGWKLREEHGIRSEQLTDAQALARWQPGLSPTFSHGTLVRAWQRIDDPLHLCQTLAASFLASGGRLRQANVRGLARHSAGVAVTLQGDALLTARQVVVAAGAWSHHLAATLGDRIPLETERGYNTTLPPGAFDLRRQLTFGGHGFVVAPIAGGVRVGGAVELGGLRAPPNFRRSEVLLAKAKRFLPGLKTEGGTQWMGFRPSLPDSLPVIGLAPSLHHVCYAFGHGHLGLTQSAATAELVHALLAGQEPAVSLQPFSPARF